MRNARLWIMICLFVLSLLMSTACLCACEKKDESPLAVYLEGAAYRGAELNLYATVTDDALKDSVAFTITEGQENCYIYDGKLKILNSAVVGATIAITVQAGEYSQVVQCTIGTTPVKEVTISPVAAVNADESVDLHAAVLPAYADDNAISFVVVEGADIAIVTGSTLHIAATADKSDVVRVVAVAGGVESAPVTVPIATVQATDIVDIEAIGTTLHRGESTRITPRLVPADANVAVHCALVRSDYADTYITLDGDTLRVDDEAPEGLFDVRLTAGTLEKVLHFTVEKTAVTLVVLSRAEEGDTVYYGSVINTACRVYPIDATYRDVTYSVAEGAEFVEALPEAGCWRVTTRQIGVSIVLRATADGRYGDLRLVTVGVPITEVVLSADGGTSVQVGDTRALSGRILPAEAQGTIVYSVTEGNALCTLDGNVITFIRMEEGNDSVVVCGTVGDTVGYITFHVVPVPVQSIVISTMDATSTLRMGQSVTFSAEVSPSNATYGTVVYRIVEGASFGTMNENVFTAGNSTVYGNVVVEAVSADGVHSNSITLTVEPNAYQPTFATWSDLDAQPHLFDKHGVVVLDCSALPANANDCVVVVSDDVEVLTVIGRYQGSLNSCFSNLYFYFLTTDSISVYLRNVGIRIDNGFTDTVLDFGGQAAVTLVAENSNYISAGSAYAVSTTGFMVEGGIDDLRLMDGMDGFAGQNGGTALSAYQLTLSGAGNLVLVGGDASSGTDGTDGLSTTDAYTYAGNGGRGGNGGEGGYAIYANAVTYDFTGSVNLYAGASGMAGKGGAAGTGSATLYHGKVGRDGVNGSVHDAVYAAQIVSLEGYPSHNMGVIRANTVVRTFDTVAGGAELLANHFKVNVVYSAGWVAGHTGSYNMTKLGAADTAEIVRLLHGLDYALQTLGHNVMIDVSAKSKVNVYLCKSIRTKSTAADIYGLTDDGNNIWYSAFETRKRDSFYSTYYNIMVHELLHVLYFQASAATQSALGVSTLSDYNNGVPYYHPNNYTISANNNSVGVYNSVNDDGATCAFLTTYGKYDNKEDISETLSVMCIQAGRRTFLQQDSAIYRKAMYISGVFAAEYAALDMWKPLPWFRFAR